MFRVFPHCGRVSDSELIGQGWPVGSVKEGDTSLEPGDTLLWAWIEQKPKPSDEPNVEQSRYRIWSAELSQ